MSQTNHGLINREAFVAGQFYPADPQELVKEMDLLFAKPVKRISPDVQAVIAPHAGYVYSASVAASSYMQIDRDKTYDNIFLIGSSHRISFDGASIYTNGNFITPLGTVDVNINLSEKLVKEFRFFSTRTDAQLYEHSLEVQLPFLQYWLHKPFRIVPIVLGTQNMATCRKIAEALMPYFNSSNLFVISSDFSHYPAYKDAQITDHKTAEAILTNKPDQLIKTIERNEEAGISGLATSLCGWTSVLTLMYITEKMSAISYNLIDYKNSGDARNVGDKSRVVGYCAIAVFPEKQAAENTPDQNFQFSQEDKSILLGLAHGAIQTYATTGKPPKTKPEGLSPLLLRHAGAFVTLYKQGKLRGCIGRFNPDIPLYELVQDMAISSAYQDYRFTPVEKDEIPDLRIEISVLTPLRRIGSPDEIMLGKHGIYMKKGSNSGTFLPQVAASTGWSLEEFLGHCARDKAGIGWEGWKDAELYTYEAIALSEK